MGVGWSAPLLSRFSPRKDPVPIVEEAGWAPGPVWTGAENLAPPEFDPRTAHLVASRYTDWAIAALKSFQNLKSIYIFSFKR